MRYQVTTHCPSQTSAVHPEDEMSQPSHSSREVPSSTSKMGIHLKLQAPQAGSPYTRSAPHLQRNAMNPVTKTHTALHPNTRINPAKTRKTASLHANVQHLQHRGPPQCGQRRNPIWKMLPWSSTPHPEAITSVSQMSNSPLPARLLLQLPAKQLVRATSDQCLVTAYAP